MILLLYKLRNEAIKRNTNQNGRGQNFLRSPY